jgi:hypothetical protein
MPVPIHITEEDDSEVREGLELEELIPEADKNEEPIQNDDADEEVQEQTDTDPVVTT